MEDSPVQNVGIKIKVKHSPNPTAMATSATGESQLGNDLMISYFRLNPSDVDQKTNEKLAYIHRWASERAESDSGEMGIVTILKDIKYRLGSPNLGISDVDHVYNYVKLRSASEMYDARAKAMEK